MNVATPVETLVTDHLDLWTTALKRKSTAGRGSSSKVELYGIKKLRELILELAVRGLLVPQDPNDEPASELLKMIAAEKAKLEKEGKIKNNKSLLPVDAEERPFELPEGWQWERFGNLAEHNAGKTLDQGRNQGELRDYITTSNLYWGKFDLSGVRQMPIADADLDKCQAIHNDLLICEGGEAGRAAVWNHDYPICFQNHIHRARFWQGINPYYACRLLEKMSYSGEINNYRKGVAISNMSGKALGSIPFPLPPLPEQHRIVAKVDELMALCDQLEQQTEASLGAHQTLVETLLSGLTSAADHAQFASAWQRIAGHFDTLFTTQESTNRLREVILYLAAKGILVKFPESSKRVVLKEILSFGPRNGFSPKESPNETGQKVLKLGATSYGSLDLSQVKSFDDEIEPDSHLWLRAGDILIQRGNSHIFVGSNVLIEEDIENIIYPDLMMKLRVKEGILASYVSLYLSAPPARAHMWDSMTGTSGTMPKISKGVAESISIVVPSIDVQERIVLKTKQLLALCDQLKSRLSDAQTTQLHLADALVEQAIC